MGGIRQLNGLVNPLCASIPDSVLRAVKDRLSIVDVIGRTVKLTKRGSNYKGLCPFHGEKTPSFNVSETKQLYYCFGCGRGGDLVRFVQD
jgi:DNA primase